MFQNDFAIKGTKENLQQFISETLKMQLDAFALNTAIITIESFDPNTEEDAEMKRFKLEDLKNFSLLKVTAFTEELPFEWLSSLQKRFPELKFYNFITDEEETCIGYYCIDLDLDDYDWGILYEDEELDDYMQENDYVYNDVVDEVREEFNNMLLKESETQAKSIQQDCDKKIKQLATFKDWKVIRHDNKLEVYKNGQLCEKATPALREIAKELGIEVNPEWRTSQLRRNVVKAMLTAGK